MVTHKLKAFLMLEAVGGFMIACLAVFLLALTLGEGKRVEKQIEGRVDRALAYHILAKTNEREILLHDHLYQKAAGKRIYDAKTDKIYEVK